MLQAVRIRSKSRGKLSFKFYGFLNFVSSRCFLKVQSHSLNMNNLRNKPQLLGCVKICSASPPPPTPPPSRAVVFLQASKYYQEEAPTKSKDWKSIHLKKQPRHYFRFHCNTALLPLKLKAKFLYIIFLTLLINKFLLHYILVSYFLTLPI